MQVNCFECKYFHITWDSQNPRGCRAFNFKSKQLPSVVVRQSSGMECEKFMPKKKQEGSK